MRIKRDYAGAFKGIFAWAISRFKPLTVHTEAIFLDDVWEEIKKRVEKHKIKKWYIMTPTNYDYFKSSFNIKLSKQKISEIMKERYAWMINQGEILELHIHFSLTMNNITFKEQENLLNEACLWMKKELNLEPKELVPGWWAYNQDTVMILRRKNIKLIKERDYDYTHDYNWAL